MHDIAAFLIEAKRNTYAAHGDAASLPPLLPGSKQLEHQVGRYMYRDIYFGMGHFVGQESVYVDGRIAWSMVYSGGVSPTEPVARLGAIYGFLRQALQRVETGRPFRGPSHFASGPFTYDDKSEGDLFKFSGEERILDSGRCVYQLTYAGGMIR
jgi:hypothetical protein